MALEFKMPQLGESVVEGTIGKWLKQVGDPVQEFEPLLEVVTDKVDTEVPSPATGVLLEIRAQEGETVKVGRGDCRHRRGRRAAGQQAACRRASAAGSSRTAQAQTGSARRKRARPAAGGPRLFHAGGGPHRRRARRGPEPGVRAPVGRGASPRRTCWRYLEAREQAPAPPAKAGAWPPPTPPPAPKAPPAPVVVPGLAAGDVEVPLSKMRQAIVHHMRQSKDTAAHVTTFWEVDLSRVVAYRNAHKAEFAAEGVKLTYTPFFVEAIVAGLKAYPMLNAVLAGDKMIYKRAINIGLAVDLGEEGLIVPVVKHADEKNLRGLARAVNDLAERARAGKLLPDDVQGGTFSLTNHGVHRQPGRHAHHPHAPGGHPGRGRHPEAAGRRRDRVRRHHRHPAHGLPEPQL